MTGSDTVTRNKMSTLGSMLLRPARPLPHHRRIVRLIAVLLIVMWLAACAGDDDDPPADPETGSNTISTSTTALPEGLPLPVPDGGTVSESIIVTTEEDANFYQVTVSYPIAEFASLVQFYKDEAAAFPDAIVDEVTDAQAATSGSARSLLVTSEASELIVAVTEASSTEAQLIIFAPEEVATEEPS